MNSELATSNSPLATSPATDQEVLVKVDGVSKKFCRSLKKSLWYGLCDIGAELNPMSRKAEKLKFGNSETGSLSAFQNVSVSEFSPAVARDEDLRDGEFYAVRDVSFELRRGECLGLIGHNGAGKTTLLKMLNGLIKPDAGTITMRGRVGALIALGAGFNPILTGRENIYINGSVLGLSKKEIDEKIDEIIDFAEIGEFIDMPVQNYSSGMQVRLGFAVATALDPDILILDEVLAVGDKDFRDRCYQRIGSLIDRAAVIFVSHDENSVRRVCDRALLLDQGKMLCLGGVDEALIRYSDLKPRERAQTQITFDPDYLSGVTVSAEIIAEHELASHHSFSIEISVDLDCSDLPEGVLALGNVVQSTGLYVGQFDFSRSLQSLKRGINQFRFRLENISLNQGTYRLSLVVFSKGGKKLLFAARDFFAFEEKCNQTFGPPVFFPVV